MMGISITCNTLPAFIFYFNMKKTSLLGFFFFASMTLLAQQFVKKAIQVETNTGDGANSVVQIEGNRFLLSGGSRTIDPSPHGRSFIMVTDSVGNVLCEKLFRSRGNESFDVMYDYKKLFNSYYAIGSYFDTLTMEDNTYLIKTDDSCNAQIFRFDFGMFEKMIRLYPYKEDSTILILGYHYIDTSFNSSQILLAKVDTNGNVLWTRQYGGAGYDFAYHLFEMPDKGYMLSGEKTTFPFPNNTDTDLFLMKLDAQFNEIWTQSYGTADEDRAGFSNNSLLTEDTSIIMVGWVNIPNPSFATSKGYVIKTDIDGNLLWEKFHEAGGFYIVEHHSVQPATDGNYFVGGYKNDTNTLQLNSWLMKIDNDGNMLWERLHAIDSAAQYIWDMNLNSHGGVAMTGFIIYQGPAANDIVFITTDSCGYTEGDVSIAQIQLDTLIDKTITLHNASPVYCSWQWQFGDGDSSSIRNPTHTYNDTGSYTITLVTRAGNDWDTAWLQVHVGDTSTVNSPQTTVVQAQMKLYPNPASSFIMLSGYIPENETGAQVEFYDMQGRLVKTELLKNGLINQGISTKDFAAGVYAYRVRSDAARIAAGRIFIEP